MLNWNFTFCICAPVTNFSWMTFDLVAATPKLNLSWLELLYLKGMSRLRGDFNILSLHSARLQLHDFTSLILAYEPLNLTFCRMSPSKLLSRFHRNFEYMYMIISYSVNCFAHATKVSFNALRMFICDIDGMRHDSPSHNMFQCVYFNYSSCII